MGRYGLCWWRRRRFEEIRRYWVFVLYVEEKPFSCVFLWRRWF
jgi:hypothetical protein